MLFRASVDGVRVGARKCSQRSSLYCHKRVDVSTWVTKVFSPSSVIRSYGLALFGTPHDGGNDTLVKMGKTAIAIVRGIFRKPPNDIMQGLSHGSLFADILQAHWRHQLDLYRIVSFYEKQNKHHVSYLHYLSDGYPSAEKTQIRIVPRESAVIGHPGHIENQISLDADHSEMCRFDPSNSVDMDNFSLVNGNMKELYEGALQKQGETISKLVDEELERRFAALRDPKEVREDPSRVL